MKGHTHTMSDTPTTERIAIEQLKPGHVLASDRGTVTSIDPPPKRKGGRYRVNYDQPGSEGCYCFYSPGERLLIEVAD